MNQVLILMILFGIVFIIAFFSVGCIQQDGNNMIDQTVDANEDINDNTKNTNGWLE